MAQFCFPGKIGLATIQLLVIKKIHYAFLCCNTVLNSIRVFFIAFQIKKKKTNNEEFDLCNCLKSGTEVSLKEEEGLNNRLGKSYLKIWDVRILGRHRIAHSLGELPPVVGQPGGLAGVGPLDGHLHVMLLRGGRGLVALGTWRHLTDDYLVGRKVTIAIFKARRDKINADG